MDRSLAQEILTPCELQEQLIIQVVPVRYHNQGGIVQRTLQELCKENHGQRLAASLRMPEHTAASVPAVRACLLYRFHRLPDRKILVIGRKDLRVIAVVPGKQDEVVKDVEEALLRKHPLEKRGEIGKLRIRVVAVSRLPFHEALEACGNGAGPRLRLVADDAERVVDKHARDGLLQICLDLLIGVLDGDLIRLRGFQLHQNDRHAIQKDNDIRPLRLVFLIGPLVGNDKAVIGRRGIIHEIDNAGLGLPRGRIRHRDAVLQVVHEHLVLRQHGSGFVIFDLVQRFRNCRGGEPAVDPLQGPLQLVLDQRIRIITLNIRPIEMPVTHGLEKLDDGIFKIGFRKP